MGDSVKYKIIGFACGIAAALTAWSMMRSGPLSSEAYPSRDAKPTVPSGAEGGSGAVADAALPVLVLPADLAEGPQSMQVEVKGHDVRRLILRLSEVTRPVRVRVPLGAEAVAVKGGGVTPLLVTADTEAIARPGRTTRVDLPIVGTDIKRTGRPSSTMRFQLSPPGKDSRAVAFLTAAAGKDTSWSFRQVGVWMLTHNVSLSDVDRLSLVTSYTGLAMGAPSSETRIGSDDLYRDLERTFESLGFDPGEFALFRQRHEELRRTLAALAPANPSPKASGYLSAHTLKRYQSPELEKRFLAFAVDAARPDLRDRAVRALIERPMSGPADALWKTALADGPRTGRLLAAWALAKRGDRTALPLVAALARDPALDKAVGRRFERLVDSRRQLRRDKDEDTLTYWLRAVGWKELSAEAKGKDLTAVKAAADALAKVKANQAILTEALSSLAGSDRRKAGAALKRLSRHCSDRPEAFEAVRRLALSGPTDDLRREAQCAIAAFDGFDLAALWPELLAKETRPRNVTSLLYAVNNAKSPARGALFESALDHAQPAVRRIAAILLAPEAHPRADAVLAGRAARETDRAVWSAILSRLRRNQSDQVPAVLARGMDFGADRDRISACEEVVKAPGVSPDLRARALKMLTDYGFGRAGKASQCQAPAMQALCRTDLEAAWPVVAEILIYKRGYVRNQAWRALTRHWSGKPEATKIARRLRLDRDLGDRADAYLKQYGGNRPARGQ